jgi:small GTP-binding protein
MNVGDQAVESKVILVGRTTVGKTSIVNASLTGTFSVETRPTIGAGFSIKMFESDGRRSLFQVWDTAGHERFRSMTPLYYRGAAFALIVFAIDDRQSFVEIDAWRQSLADSLTAVSVILVANKSDLADERVVSETEARLKAQEIRARYIEVSAKTGQGIDEIFKIMAEELRQNTHRVTRAKPGPLPEPTEATSGCC